jgi:hypothetical protein
MRGVGCWGTEEFLREVAKNQGTPHGRMHPGG